MLKTFGGCLSSMVSKMNFGTFHIDLKWYSRKHNSGFTDSVCDDAYRVKIYYYIYSSSKIMLKLQPLSFCAVFNCQ